MNEMQHESSVEAEAAVARQPMGSVLFAARQQQQLSIDDVSNRLRLSSRQIVALETDHFDDLPEPMITRGFIRNYARLLHLDAAPLLDAYQAQAPSEHFAISIDSANITIKNSRGPGWRLYLALSLVIAILLGLWLYFTSYVPVRLAQQAAVAPAAEQSAAPAAAVYESSAALPPAEPAAAASDTASADVPVATAGEATSPAPATLQFSFSDSSWVSVTDAAGKEILNVTKPAGSQQLVQGRSPFSVVVGNAAATTVLYNDKPVDLAAHTRLNVARFTLE